MSEHEPISAEAREAIEAAKAELAEAAKVQHEKLSEGKAETNSETKETRVEKARDQINSQEDRPTADHTEPVPAHRKLLLDKTLNYQQTLASLQRQLSPTSRQFSKVIHQPVIEKTSEVLEKTVLRPSVALGATTTAFIVGAFFYLTARHYGFALSGSEIIFSLIVGAILGLIIEWLVNLLHRRSSQ